MLLHAPLLLAHNVPCAVPGEGHGSGSSTGRYRVVAELLGAAESSGSVPERVGAHPGAHLEFTRSAPGVHTEFPEVTAVDAEFPEWGGSSGSRAEGIGACPEFIERAQSSWSTTGRPWSAAERTQSSPGADTGRARSGRGAMRSGCGAGAERCGAGAERARSRAERRGAGGERTRSGAECTRSDTERTQSSWSRRGAPQSARRTVDYTRSARSHA